MTAWDRILMIYIPTTANAAGQDINHPFPPTKSPHLEAPLKVIQNPRLDPLQFLGQVLPHTHLHLLPKRAPHQLRRRPDLAIAQILPVALVAYASSAHQCAATDLSRANV